MRLSDRTPGLDLDQRLNDQLGAKGGKPVMQFAGSGTGLDRHVVSEQHRAGIETLGQLLDADEDALKASVGDAAGPLRAAARGDLEEPVAVAAPPSSIVEETPIRSLRNDHEALEAVLDGLAERACRRLRPFGLRAGNVTVEVRRTDGVLRRSETIDPGIADEATACEVTRSLAAPLLSPAAGIRALAVRFSRLSASRSQASLFPEIPGLAR